MTVTAKKLFIRNATIVALGLVAAIALSIPEDAMAATKAQVQRGKSWAETCKKTPRPATCCFDQRDQCAQDACALPPPWEGMDCYKDCEASVNACLNGVEKQGLQTPSFVAPQQKLAPTAPMSPKPGQTAPQPGVLAPTPVKPLLNRPSKTAPQQLKKAPTIQPVPRMVSPNTQPSFGGSNILEGGGNNFSCSAKFCECKEGTAECIDLGSANLCDKNRPMLCSGGRCICNRK